MFLSSPRHISGCVVAANVCHHSAHVGMLENGGNVQNTGSEKSVDGCGSVIGEECEPLDD